MSAIKLSLSLVINTSLYILAESSEAKRSKFSEKIITDSGGLQREAYFLEKPCICIYDHAYWPEIEEEGWQIITGINKDRIINSIQNFNPKAKQGYIFGKGDSAQKIINKIEEFDFETCFDY